MRSFLITASIGLGACNGASPSNPPPHVDPPVIACTLQTDAAPTCSPFDSADASGDASTATCDAGPPVYQYDQCAVPPSVCADSHWAAYFDNGTCVKGTCELVTKYHYCETGCGAGGCYSTGPTAANRGF